MIKRLKRNFIMLNMALVTIVLVLVFGFLYLDSSSELKEQSYRALEASALPDLPKDPMRPPERRFNNVFGFLYTGDGTVTAEEGLIQYDEEELLILARAVLEREETTGVLGAYDLRFVVQETIGGFEMDFMDISMEKEFLGNLLLTMSLIGVATLTVFFAISLFLANRMIRPVERSWNKQRRFVADASHELRTPLSVILANTSLLLEEGAPDEIARKEWIGYINDEARRMKKLVEDLLFLARTDEQGQNMVFETVELSNLIYEVALMFEPILFEKKLTFEYAIDDGIVVKGNRDQLRQVALILLDNASKYTPEGETITLSLKSHSRIGLSVKNTGTYIEPEQYNRIFDRFYKIDEARTREKMSFGLGLSIAKEIADSHQGSIRVVSDPESGTTFTLKMNRLQK